MQIEWQIVPSNQWRTDAAVFFVFEKSREHLPGLKAFLEDGGNWLAHSAALPDFQGKTGEVAVLYAPAGNELVRRVILAGLGPADKFETEKLKNAAAFALRKCREMGLKQPGIPIAAFEGICGEASFLLCGDPAERIAHWRDGRAPPLQRNEDQELGCPAGPESILLLCEADPDPL